MAINDQSTLATEQEIVVLPANLPLEQLAEWIKLNQAMSKSVRRVDFTALQEADSGVLALLVYWFSQVSTPQPIEVVGLPDRLRPLIALYDLEEMLVEVTSA